LVWYRRRAHRGAAAASRALVYSRRVAQIRIALAQTNLCVGDLARNTETILDTTARAAAAGAHLVAFPEMALTGYPVEDLVLRGSFVAASRAALTSLARRLADAGHGELPVVVGYLDGSPHDLPRIGRPAGSPLDAMAVLHHGEVVLRSAKHHLPNYGVFDEYRYFVPGRRLPLVRVRGVDIAIVVCEDLWQDGGPVAAVAKTGAGLLLAINASPYERNKDDVRLELVTRRAREANCTLAYVNLVGGQDELVFDGDSLVVDADGTTLARAGVFREELLVVDLDVPAAAIEPPRGEGADGLRIDHVTITPEPVEPYPPLVPTTEPRLADEAEVYRALVLGLRDYVRKNNFRSVLLGLSGGIDSALSAAIAVDALGPEAVYGVSMPSRYSSTHSLDDAAELARRTGLHYSVVEIAPMVTAYETTLREAGFDVAGLAAENLQARVRGTTLMTLSNQYGHLVLAPGNKSEISVGYTTLYGDAIGGFAPIKDVPKTLVWQLATWRNAATAECHDDPLLRHSGEPPIPESSISKAPSAELRPGQTDVDSLPPYELLDEILDAYVNRDQGIEQIIAAGFEPALVADVLRMVDTAEYKRRQYPPGTKISVKAFGRDRRLPITNRWREHGSL
jgi:NAD+ synthase (glutamine-hydrolysing)